MSDRQIQSPETPGIGVPERLRPLLHELETICAELAGLTGTDPEAIRRRAGELAEAYRNVDGLPPEYAEIMARKFADADAAWQRSLAAAEEAARQREQWRSDLAQTIAEHDRLAAENRLLPNREKLTRLRCRWQTLVEQLAEDGPQRAELAAAEQQDLARLAQEEASAGAAKLALAELAAELETLHAGADPEAFQRRREALEVARKEAQAAVDPADPENAAKLARCRELWKQLNMRLTQYFQTLDLARWESYTLKLDLCRELEAMQEMPDSALPTLGARLREIRARWQALGAVPREKQHELGPRYYECTTKLQRRIDEFFKQRRTEHAAAAQAKTALCEEAEALADSTEWNATTEKFKALQQRWKEAGHAGREADGKLYTRFRAACDRFFQARNADWTQRQQERSAGAARRAALCEAAEKLGELPPAEAVRTAKSLRAEYQAAPRAGKVEPELNARFNAAMDAFFGGRRTVLDAAKERREAILTELEALSGAPDPAAAETRMRELRDEWRALPPAPRDAAGRLESRARAAAVRLEKQLAAERERRQATRGEFFAPALRECAALVTAARAGGPLPEVTLDLSLFPKLGALATDLVAAGGIGDEIEKALARNTREFHQTLDALEQAAAGAEAPAAGDLAAELAAAIAGNFGGGASFVRREATPAELLRKLLATGMPEPAELELLLSRYEAVKHLK